MLFEVDPKRLSDDFVRVAAVIGEVIQVFANLGLRVNESKTDAILFRATRRKITVPGIKIGSVHIQPSETVRCLGLVLHERLSWREHLRGIIPKCYAVIALLNRLRTMGFPAEGRILVYKGAAL